MDRLPEEIMDKILRRLPKRSRARFQCVSKQWQRLIKEAIRPLDSGFVVITGRGERLFHMNFYRLHTNGDLTFDHPINPWTTLHYPYEMTSCNGCFLRLNISENRDYYGWYNLYNPFTKRSFAIPPPREGIRYGNVRLYGFASDLNFDDHYKLIVISHGLKTISIFNSETLEWKTKQVDYTKDSVYDSGCASLYLNGRMYWKPFNSPYFPKTKTIVCCVKSGCLWESWGRLNYGIISHEEYTLLVWVDQLDGDHDDDIHRPSNWTQILNVSLRTWNIPFPLKDYHILAFNEHLQTIFLETSLQFLCYDIPARSHLLFL